MRNTKEVLEDHLNLSNNGTIEEDLNRNYAEDLLLLTSKGIYKGHEGLKKLMATLRQEVPDASYEYNKLLTEGEVGFLEWSCSSKNTKIEDGADSYVVRDGRIVVQTIHYTVTPKNGPE